MAGPGPVLYLDVDDEITSAAARVRAVEGTKVALVVPPGSRVATSRINFRLLARDAGVHGRRLAIIAPDAASRALAAAAGLEVFASVAEYEVAMGGGPPPAAAPPGTAGDGGEAPAGRPGAGSAALAGATVAGAAAAGLAAASRPPVPPKTARRRGSAKATGSATQVAPPAQPGPPKARPAPPTMPESVPPPTGGDELRPRSAAASARSVEPPRRRSLGGPAVLAAIGLVALGGLVVLGVAGYLLLPSATIVVTPRVESVGPIQVTVTADPDATEVDAEAGVVPAARLPLDVQAEGTYKATGERVVEAKATGTVRFTNCDFLAAHEVNAGSRVSTESRIAFTTDESIVIPAAEFKPPNRINCADRDVGVTAVKAGTAGNVPADTITVVPGDQNPLAVRVTNRAPTSGGTHESFPRVTGDDIAAAQKDLAKKLDAAFAALVADPATAPAGTTLFPETAALGEPAYQGDPASLVGQEVAEFTMSATASGTVVTVDETPVTEVAASRIDAEVDDGYQLVEGSVETQVGDPTVDGERVAFPATVTALQQRQLDAAELETLVLGMTPDEASAALAPYGQADISISPDWATTIPTWGFRVDLSIAGSATPTPGSGAGRSPEASPAASPSPSAS